MATNSARDAFPAEVKLARQLRWRLTLAGALVLLASVPFLVAIAAAFAGEFSSGSTRMAFFFALASLSLIAIGILCIVASLSLSAFVRSQGNDFGAMVRALLHGKKLATALLASLLLMIVVVPAMYAMARVARTERLSGFQEWLQRNDR